MRPRDSLHRYRLRRHRALCVGAALILSIAAGCAQELRTQRLDANAPPQTLSEWGVLLRTGSELQRPADGLVYAINTPLFSDYAAKLRTLSLPTGGKATFDADDTFGFPAGTIVSKTFYLDSSGEPALFADNSLRTAATGRLLETRLLVRTDSEWVALPYVWRADGSDADLALTGDIIDLPDGNLYVVPTRNECSSCHAQGKDKRLRPIGLKARHLQRQDDDSALRRIAARGWLDVPAAEAVRGNAVWQSTRDWSTLDDTALAHAARSYLDANCGHCHHPEGAADTSRLFLDYAIEYSTRDMGRCKPPIAAGRGTGGRLYDYVPGQPGASIMVHRMASTDPGAMMPEIGRTRAHAEGVALISEWVRRQEGTCL